MSTDTVDPDAFNAFEAAGWDERADGYHRFFGAITTRVIEPLLDAAEVGRGIACSTWRPDQVTRPPRRRGAGESRRRRRRGRDGDACPKAPPGSSSCRERRTPAVRRRHLRSRRRQPSRPPRRPAGAGRCGARPCARARGRVALSTWDVPERARLFGVAVDAAQKREPRRRTFPRAALLPLRRRSRVRQAPERCRVRRRRGTDALSSPTPSDATRSGTDSSMGPCGCARWSSGSRGRAGAYPRRLRPARGLFHRYRRQCRATGVDEELAAGQKAGG